MLLQKLREIPRFIHHFNNKAWEYERKAQVALALCVSLVYLIYGLLTPLMVRLGGLPESETLPASLLGMGVIVLVSLGYAGWLWKGFDRSRMSTIGRWAFSYYTFLVVAGFLLWFAGHNVSLSPLFLSVIGFGITWLHTKAYVLYTSCVLSGLTLVVLALERDWFWVLELVILYLFAVSLHLFHTGMQCRLYAYQHQVELDRNLDGLTGLLNRRALTEAMPTVPDSPLGAAILVDLDHFKEVNDTFGHQAGDQALTTAAQILRAVFGREGLVCRLGGDEFFILQPLGQDGETALTALLEELLRQVPLVFQQGQQQVAVTFSVGAFLCSRTESHDPEELISQADAAMYQVKESGRNAAILHRQGFPDRRLPGSTAPARVLSLD